MLIGGLDALQQMRHEFLQMLKRGRVHHLGKRPRLLSAAPVGIELD
jgi:hypothetical protein